MLRWEIKAMAKKIRFNLMDLIIILVAALVIFGGFYVLKSLKGGTASGETANVNIRYTVELTKEDEEILNLFLAAAERGDRFGDPGGIKTVFGQDGDPLRNPGLDDQIHAPHRVDQLRDHHGGDQHDDQDDADQRKRQQDEECAERIFEDLSHDRPENSEILLQGTKSGRLNLPPRQKKVRKSVCSVFFEGRFTVGPCSGRATCRCCA